MKSTTITGAKFLIATLAIPFIAGCHTDMWVQPKELSQQESDFFVDGASNRPLISHTEARGHLELNSPFFTGYENGKLVSTIPGNPALTQGANGAPGQKIDKAFLLRGKDRYTIFCTPCHGQLGDGNGMIAQRGFSLRRPVGNYHTDRLRRMPIGHFFDVMTNGYGAMFSYRSRIEPQDRWAIAVYIRVLQLSQHAPANAVPADKMQDLANKPSTTQEVASR